MEVFARLEGDPQLSINATNPPLRNLNENSRPVWNWLVTPDKNAKENQILQLRLLTGVVVKMPDGSSKEFGNDPIDKNIKVKISVKGWREVIVRFFKEWGIALGSIIGTITGVLVALKKLRKAKDELVEEGSS
jgi:hypothetical protein